MAQLSDLPLEVKHMILAYVDASAPQNPTQFPSQSKRSELGLYASVSREWQLFFEQRLYAHLVLTQYCLVNFSKLAPRQRQLVRYIWLRLRLVDYTCSKCPYHQSWVSKLEDLSTFKQSIPKLFRILNEWGTYPENDLTLEISAYSPSDVNHAIKGDKYLSSDLVEMEDMVPQKEALIHDLDHGWKGGQLMQSYDIDDVCFIRGVLGLFLFATVPQSISTAHVVTQLVFRRTTRQFVLVSAIESILRRLPNLRQFTYEYWRPLTRLWPVHLIDTDYQQVISEFLPKTLKTLNWFEDFNEVVNRIYYEDDPLNELARIGSAKHATSSRLAHRSVSLEQVTGCYSIDAVPFFKAAVALWTWPILTTLSLTCSLFIIPEKHNEITALLARIGLVAQRMPQLQTLDIWYGKRRHAAAFRYRVTDKLITISWRGTWELDLGAKEQEIIEIMWKDLARAQGKRDLYVGTYRLVESKDVTSHAAAIRLLEIGQSVIHPASLEEISRETKCYFSS